MRFLSCSTDYPAEAEAVIEQHHCQPFGPLVFFFLAIENIDLLSQQVTDRSFPPAGTEALRTVSRLRLIVTSRFRMRPPFL